MTGKKFDGGKAPLVQGCLNYFPKALMAVAMVSKYGAEKYKVPYTDKNWAKLENALARYTDGDARHLLGEAIDGLYDPESHLLHAAHHLWNAAARLELLLDSGVALEQLDTQHKDDDKRFNAPNPVKLPGLITNPFPTVDYEAQFQKRMAVDADGGAVKYKPDRLPKTTQD